MRIRLQSAATALVLSSLIAIPSAHATTAQPSQGSLAHQASDTSSLSLAQQREILVKMAETQLNVPYIWGKQEPFVGFDCSNFVAWTYRSALGIDFSGSSVWQRYHEGTPVSTANLQVGDLLFFKTKNEPSGSGHEGIYIGNGEVIQEGGGWKKVTVEPLRGTWLGNALVYARLVLK